VSLLLSLWVPSPSRLVSCGLSRSKLGLARKTLFVSTPLENGYLVLYYSGRLLIFSPDPLSMVEMTLSIIVVALPGLKPLVRGAKA
jgi:hypothetical protein